MSSQSSVASVFPAGLSLQGGIPTKHQDLAASIIFFGCYIVLVPFLVWRLCAKSSRCFTMIRPAIFVIVRLVTFAIRAIQADGHYNKNLFITEQVLLLCGFILICEPLVTLTRYHVTQNLPPSDGANRTPTQLIMRLLQVALTIALALGAYAGTKFGDLNNASDLKTVKTLRDANAAICLAVTGLCALVLIGCSLKNRLPFFPTVHLISISIFLCTVSTYKLVCYELKAPSNPLSTGTKIAFYCFSSIPELIVACLLLIVNCKSVHNIEEATQKDKVSSEMKKALKNGTTYQGRNPWQQGSGLGWQRQQAPSQMEWPTQMAPYYQQKDQQYPMNNV